MGGSLVAVVVVVLLVVEAAVLEGLVPFLVPVTNSICGNKRRTSECQRKCFDLTFDHHLAILSNNFFCFVQIVKPAAQMT